MCLGIQKFYVVECLIECLYHADRRSPPAKSSNQGSCSNYTHLSHYSPSKMFGPLHFEENSYLPWICLFVSKGGGGVIATARVHWYPPYDDCRICPSILRALRRILFESWRHQRLVLETKPHLEVAAAWSMIGSGMRKPIRRGSIPSGVPECKLARHLQDTHLRGWRLT